MMAASPETARKILQARQNSFVAGGALTGGRKRPVTISLVAQAELIAEVGASHVLLF